MKTTFTIMALLASLTATSVMAEGHGAGKGKRDRTAAPGVDKRVANQKKRIAHKLEKGKITQEEANKLNSEVDAVKAKEAELSADGKLTKEERKTLHQDLKKSGEEIKNTKPEEVKK
jgi:peptidoglycan hydrolase CwlO-like protein